MLNVGFRSLSLSHSSGEKEDLHPQRLKRKHVVKNDHKHQRGWEIECEQKIENRREYYLN